MTFDTGALIAIEARRARIKQILAAAQTLADVVHTSDPVDRSEIARYFPGVRILST